MLKLITINITFRTHFIGLLILCSIQLIVACVSQPIGKQAKIQNSKDHFIYQIPVNGKKIKVLTYSPPSGRLKNQAEPQSTDSQMPVVFVMHGASRTAWDYREAWIESANMYGFHLIVPEFSKTYFPRNWDYNFGNMMSSSYQLKNKEEWSFSAIEGIFNQFTSLKNIENSRYAIYGHSAGSQFVHRMLTFTNTPNVCIAVAANAGSYTFLDFDIDYPFGLAKTSITDASIKMLLAKPLEIMLGEKDNNPSSSRLPSSKAATKQGLHRFERGQNYYSNSFKIADELGAEFNWGLRFVPRVGHNNRKMAPHAAQLIHQNRLDCLN